MTTSSTDHSAEIERFAGYLDESAQMAGPVDGEFFDEAYGRVSSYQGEPSVTYVNEAGIVDDWENVQRELRGNRDIASAIERWSRSLAEEANNTTSVDMFNRNKWEGAKHIHAQMSMCAWAVENDDILSGTADVLEGLMWQGCRFELFDEDQQDVWNQWAAEFDLDSRLREMGRELFKVSQFYVGLLWENKVYEVRENKIEETLKEFDLKRRQREYDEQVQEREALIEAGKGQPGWVDPPEIPKVPENKPGRGNRRRKKKFAVAVPTEMTLFDPTKIMPVGTFMFNRERFAYIADANENAAFTQVMQGEAADPLVRRLIERKYTPNASERGRLADMGIPADTLWLLREDAIFRHTVTRAQYEPYAAVRLKSVLPILEMKQHLRAADRAALIGNTNFIVVVTKGTDKLPAKPAEIANLQEQVRVIARLPVLVGDHRLHVDIVAPAMDNTLMQSRWEVLDSRLIFKALGSYAPVVQGGNSSGTGVSEMSLVIANGLMGRRKMIVRTLEKQIFRKILEMNEGAGLDETPSLAFTPKRITLDFKADVLQQILKLRDRGDISRETMLEEVGYDQEIEVQRRAREKAEFDHVFSSGVPHGSPTANPFGGQQPPGQPGAPGTPGAPGGNVGPAGQPRTEGGRPAGVAEPKPRAKKGAPKEVASHIVTHPNGQEIDLADESDD